MISSCANTLSLFPVKTSLASGETARIHSFSGSAACRFNSPAAVSQPRRTLSPRGRHGSPQLVHRDLPSAENVHVRTSSGCPARSGRSLPLSVSHSRTTSPLAAAIFFASGDMATMTPSVKKLLRPETKQRCCFPDTASHSTTAPPCPAVTSCLPSGDRLADITNFSSALKWRTSLPSPACQNRTFPSLCPVTTLLPSEAVARQLKPLSIGRVTSNCCLPVSGSHSRMVL